MIPPFVKVVIAVTIQLASDSSTASLDACYLLLAQIAFRQLVLATRRWKIELHQKGLPVAGESCAEGIFPTVRDRTAYHHCNRGVSFQQLQGYLTKQIPSIEALLESNANFLPHA